MTVVRLCARKVVARHFAGVLLLTLLVGLAGGAVLAAVAGARRTDSAAARLMARGKVDDIEVDPVDFTAMHDAGRIDRIPGVVDATAIAGTALCVRPCGERGITPGSLPIGLIASPDGGFGVRMDLFERIPHFRGRAPDQHRVDEVFANTIAADQLHLRVGSVLRVSVVEAPGQPGTVLTPLDLRVVAIARPPDELINSQNEDSPLLIGTQAFARRFAVGSQFGLLHVRLRDPSALTAFEVRLRRAFPGQAFDVQPMRRELAIFTRAVRPYSASLRLFGAVLALAGLLVVGEAASRAVRNDAADHTTLRALGTTRTQRAVIASCRVAIAVVAGAALAVTAGWLASPLFPLGIARPAEPQTGLRFDPLVAGAGFVAIVLALLAIVAVTAWATAARPVPRDARTPRTGSRIVAAAARAGAPVTAVAGLRFAFHRNRERDHAPLGATVFGLVVAIATTGAALTFGTNLDRFVTTPRNYGWTWDALVQSTGDPFAPAQVARFAHDRAVTGVTAGTYGAVALNGRAVSTYGMAPLHGAAMPVATKGRMPRARGEIALGTQTMRDLRAHVGGTVQASAAGGHTVALHVVGQTLLPSLARNNAMGAADGAVVTTPTLDVLEPNVRGEVDFLLVDLARGASIADLRARYARVAAISGASQPGDIRSYDRVHATPVLLAALLAVLGIAVLAHLLVTSVRARRGDLAVLKSLGFTRAQVSASIAWQASALAAVGLAVGIPAGVVAGRWSWTAFERVFGARVDPTVLPRAFVLIGAVTLLLANVIAAVPARLAARTRAATLLASE